MKKIPIEDASAWILRCGVIVSAIVMLIGIAVSALHNNLTVERMKMDRFDYQPSIIWHDLMNLHGKAIIEIGIYLLVLTPILRVVTSMILFATEERDGLYAIITFLVLILTLTGLLLLN